MDVFFYNILIEFGNSKRFRVRKMRLNEI